MGLKDLMSKFGITDLEESEISDVIMNSAEQLGKNTGQMAGNLLSQAALSTQSAYGSLGILGQSSFTAAGLQVQQQQAAQYNQLYQQQLQQYQNSLGQTVFQSSPTYIIPGTQVTSTYPGQVINIPASHTPTTYHFVPPPQPDLRTEVEELKQLVYSMRLEMAKLKGEVMRLTFPEGEAARASEEILRQMDAYIGVA